MQQIEIVDSGGKIAMVAKNSSFTLIHGKK